MSNPWDEMSRFVMGVADLVMVECRMTMLHDDMTLARLMVYYQSSDKSKRKRMTRNLKRSGSSDQDLPRFKKRVQTQEEPRSATV